MTQRYISAINYADRRAASILRKRSKKRVLGDIESRYGYTPPQPVLSCRTVDVDLNGTRTYRPKSSTDILQEQHQLIHRIYNKNRNIKSAPLKNDDDNELNLRKSQHINIEVHGRPYTSLSQVSISDNKKSLTSNRLKSRPKTTGSSKTKKPQSNESFMILRVDKDVLDSARSSKQLTEQIHELWQPEHHDLNQGKYIRGQKKPEQASPDQFNSWLTFGGNQDERGQGVVDAFAGLSEHNEYYSIDGNVGSKVAATLKKGDKVRIGVNGVVQSHKIRVKKESIQPVCKEESDLFGSEIDRFNDIVLENIDELLATKKNKADTTPLNWRDQLKKDDVKVVQSKGEVMTPRTMNLCESHPVIFERLVKPEDHPRLTAGNTEGFKVKQRIPKHTESPSKYHHVKNIQIDSRSPQQDQDAENLSYDEVLQNAIAHRNHYNSQSFKFQKDKFNTPSTNQESRIKSAKISENGRESRMSCRSSLKSRGSDIYSKSLSSTGNLLIPVERSVPSTLPATINSDELSISAAGVQHIPPVNEMPRKSPPPCLRNSSSAKSRSSGISSSTSGKFYHPPSSDTQYIKITSSIKNPKGDRSSTHSAKQSVGVRFVNDDDDDDVSVISSKQDIEINSVGGMTDRSNNSRALSPPAPQYNGFSINIPTADMLSDRDSMLQSPYKRSEEGEMLTNRQQRDISLRDEQINQITSMLAGSVVTSAL